MQSSASPENELLVGGQALIEGVMMRSPGAYGVAVRRPDGSIAFQHGKVNGLAKRYPILKLPILRGVAVLFQSLALGIRSLNFSAEQAVAAAELADAGNKVAEGTVRPEPAASAVRHELPAVRAAGLHPGLRADSEDRAVPGEIRRPAAAGAGHRGPLL